MPLIYRNTGETHKPIIVLLEDHEYPLIQSSGEFSFDWSIERKNEVYKLYTKRERVEILGLMSLIDWPSEYRIHLNLIEVSQSNRGRNKKIEHVGGCLIAFACQLAFIRGYSGFVSLKPRTRLIDWYKEKYGFQQYGRLLGIDHGFSQELIKTYLEDENE